MTGNTNALIVPGPGARTEITPREKPTAPQQNIPLGYLRAFITVLVVAHHSVLAYHPFAPPPAASLITQPRFWQAFPIVDTHRSGVFAWLVGFNDMFFMALMFLLSGLFVCQSLQRKGGAVFVGSRLIRLGLPFLVATALLSPIAYFPAYLQTTANPILADFWQQWRALGQWPTGPAWFLWVLLAFDCLAAVLFAVLPRWAEVLRERLSGIAGRPFSWFLLVVAASGVAYVPMVLKFGPLYWTSVGPFTFQTSRIFDYAIYFLVGIVLGACGFEPGLFARDGALARRWLGWCVAALAAFATATVIFILAIANPSNHQAWELLGGFSFVLSCASSSFAFLSLFCRFAALRMNWRDSLMRNAYGIYLLHYAFVTWTQYVLVKLGYPGLVKGAVVFICALALSWAVGGALRRIPAVAKVL